MLFVIFIIMINVVNPNFGLLYEYVYGRTGTDTVTVSDNKAVGWPTCVSGREIDTAPGQWRWAVGGGQWAVGSGQWAVGGGRWAVGSGRWAVGSGQWAVGSGQWAVGGGQWAVGSGYSGGHRCAAAPQDR